MSIASSSSCHRGYGMCGQPKGREGDRERVRIVIQPHASAVKPQTTSRILHKAEDWEAILREHIEGMTKKRTPSHA